MFWCFVVAIAPNNHSIIEGTIRILNLDLKQIQMRMKNEFRTTNAWKKSMYIFLLLGVFLFRDAGAQSMWGVANSGGDENTGTIFQTDENGNFLSVYNLPKISGSNPYYTSLIEQTPGVFYGITYNSGAPAYGGAIYSYNTANDTVIIHHLLDGTNGKAPFGAMIKAGNGKFYGLTYGGGANNHGVIFSFDQANNSYQKLMDFDGTNNGRNPQGTFLEATGGKFYATTISGGTSDMGVLFEFDINTNTYTKLFDFTNANGKHPNGGLQKINNKLYGLTNQGGAKDHGVLFEFDLGSNTYKKKYEFSSPISGRQPQDLVLGWDGNFYGNATYGGT
ncbi:MAG: hypothetical protein IT244_01510, partial [Bacteroidia bacterium]|nr:hypothetical protein [Bacteroidia bacterium]